MSLAPKEDFLQAPTEPAAAATPTPAPAATEAPTPSPSPSAPSVATATPAVASQAPSDSAPSNAGASTTPAAASRPADAPASWLDSFRKEGFQAADEATAQAQLLQSYRDAERLRPLAPHLSAYQQHATEFQQWLAEKNKRPPAAAESEDWTAKLGWNPPTWDPAWQHLVTKDDKGNLVGVPGAPHDIVVKYQAAQEFRSQQIEKFLQNPYKFMEPAIKHLAQQEASRYSTEGVGQYREQQEANKFIDEHKEWLFDQQNGAVKTRQVLNTQTGKYQTEKVLSRYGDLFVQNLNTAAKHGLPPDLQQSYALQAVQNAYMASPEYVKWIQSKQAPASPAAPVTSARQQANAAFTQRANPATPPAPVGGNATPAPQKVNRENLEQIMLSRFRDAGVTV